MRNRNPVEIHLHVEAPDGAVVHATLVVGRCVGASSCGPGLPCTPPRTATITPSPHDTLLRCFTPDEFAELLAASPTGIDLTSSLPPPATHSPRSWFTAAVAACHRRGLLDDPTLWTLIQRARPVRCHELHVLRRQHIARSREADPPDSAALAAAITTIARRFATRNAVVELLTDVGWRGAPPPHTIAAPLVRGSLVHLVCARDATALFRLATRVADAADVLDRLALCACDEELPPSLT